MRRYTLIHHLSEETWKVAEVQTAREITQEEEAGLWKEVCDRCPGWDGLKEGSGKRPPRYLFPHQQPPGHGNYIWDRGEPSPNLPKPEVPLLDLSQNYPPKARPQ